jgi:hypothetical protein
VLELVHDVYACCTVQHAAVAHMHVTRDNHRCAT